MRSFRLIALGIIVVALAAAALYLSRPVIEVGDAYSVRRWRTLAMGESTQEAMHLQALNHVADHELKNGELDAYWRQRVRSCCNNNAVEYSRMLTSYGLSHDEFVEVVQTYYYFRLLNDTERDNLKKEYGSDVLQWWDDLKPVFERYATGRIENPED